MEQTETCRLCLQNEDLLISTLEDGSILENIKNCVSISISENDNLPTTVCISCIDKVKDWCSFKEECIKSQTVLLTTLSSQRTHKVSEIKTCKSKEAEEINVALADERFHLKDEEFYKTDSQGYVYTCEICFEAFDSCMEYLDHQLIHDGKFVFKCSKCTEVFSYREDLVKHDQKHKATCLKCGKIVLRSSMKLHLIKHTDRFKCTTCSGCFNSQASLQLHITTLHTDKKDHICETCGKCFSSKTAINVHLKSHGNERAYKCKLCKYSGRTASALYAHISTHSNETCVCEVCSKIFKSYRNLHDHLRRVHTKQRNHKCGYCDKRFLDRYLLTVHERCHTGVRPYSCKLCNKAFNRSDGLKEHMATHGERVWHYCEKCKRKFASRKGISRHHCGPT